MTTHVLAPEADLQSFLALARSLGWNLILNQDRTHTRFRLLRWTSPNGAVTWTEHHGLGVRVVESDEPEDQLAPLPTLSAAELALATGDPDPVAAMAAINALSLAEPGDAFYAALSAHAVHPDVWVRRNARYLTQYLSGPRSADAIRAATSDPELGPLWQEQLERLERPA